MIRGFFRFIFRTFFWICASVGFVLTTLVLLLFVSKTWPFEGPVKPLAHDSVLTITLKGHYLEHTTAGGVGALLLGKEASLYNVTRTLRHAAQDKKIKGVMITVESPSLGAAQIQELRDALMAFRQTGKESWCYADSFGEADGGTALYYLATACKSIWLQPIGSVNITGLSMEVPFAKGALEKLDVKPEMVQRKEYKSYMEMFTRDDFSEHSREENQAVLDSILSQFVDGIAKERGLSHDYVRLLISNGPYLTEEALNEKLVDYIGFRYTLKPTIQKTLGKHIQFIGMESYLATLHPKKTGGKVALIFGSGTIMQNGKESPMTEVTIAANETYKAFQNAIADKDVKAIVYRINSGGGSPVASETIYGVIKYARQQGKPVIISMSDAAASGGYWIAIAGSKIVAQPTTITGSIGAFGGKFVLSGLFEKLGIKFGEMSTSENAGMWSMAHSFTPTQWLKLNAQMDHIYKAFTTRVALDRTLTPEQVEKVARGRVWTGEQALALGLVDQLGGLSLALDLARKEAGLSPDAGIHIYPHPKTLLEGLRTLFSPDEEEDTVIEAGILGPLLNPFKKVAAILTMMLSSQEMLYTPVGEVK